MWTAQVTEVPPAPLASSFEFVPERSYFVGGAEEPDLLLPASNTLQKQVACGLIGSVYCVAPCYRREPPERSATSALHTFHQIEVELQGADAAAARDTALALLGEISAQFCGRDLGTVATLDLLDLAVPPTHDTYDKWLAETVDPAVATWVLHLPQNPFFVVNSAVPGTHLSETFELLLPDGFGEVLSGGHRDPGTAADLWRRAGQSPSATPPPSSGFGIGVERLVAWLLRQRDLRDVVLPHWRV
ncbi:aspartate-ammonia ligase [Pseudonocardia oroxyli]|uniref:Aspartate-ammonia ligase n=2 Tax=Pseudonocardia oroxyli TaxID=366584 RepID=A0A1G7VV13_PSEOR|nr:aspartate-ammonia ligase [Pseudonocardia oroxyli]